MFLSACKLSKTNPTREENKELNDLFERYFDDRMKLYPLEATAIGDNRYNDLLPVEFTNTYRDTLKDFYNSYLTRVSIYDREYLTEKDKLSFDVFKREMELSLEGLNFHDNYIPFQQFSSLPLTIAQLGSGEGYQPFKTVKDYEDWLKRAKKFSVWVDSSIIYFKRGIAVNYVLPKTLVVKMIPQMEAMLVKEDTASLFYGPLKNFPADFTTSDQRRFKRAFTALINNRLIPSYKKLRNFLKNEYLRKARTTAGLNALENGVAYYQYLITTQTTTTKSAEEIYQTGLQEVERITMLQDSVKEAVKFNGNLQEFFNCLKTDKQFMPYKSAAEILAAFRAIQGKMEPGLEKLFTKTPRTPFEIRQTEAYRAESASAEYMQGSPDGSRPGIFYVPVLDATTFNTTSGMESLFLHEAIPGHHYQISLQQEDTTLPKFRRFGGKQCIRRRLGVIL
jgi:uncharacterized protein (DUF885 family)